MASSEQRRHLPHLHSVADADNRSPFGPEEFAKSGYAACALDHQGHVFSDGLLYHIPDLNPVVDDCAAFRSRLPPALPAFLYAESLGGAVALLLHLRRLGEWAGLVLNGAMCAVSDKFKPPWPLEHLLVAAAAVAPTWEVVPTRGPYLGCDRGGWRPRARGGRGRRRRRSCCGVQGRFGEVEAPLLIVHGEEDKVCDPAGVVDLHRLAKNEDKTTRMWHQLVGEDVDLVFGDIVRWFRARIKF